MAPELLKGFTQSTPAIDIWSLGVILFALLYGKLPFEGDSNEKIRAAILK
jgi:serine/threonine protein kinase